MGKGIKVNEKKKRFFKKKQNKIEAAPFLRGWGPFRGGGSESESDFDPDWDSEPDKAGRGFSSSESLSIAFFSDPDPESESEFDEVFCTVPYKRGQKKKKKCLCYYSIDQKFGHTLSFN